MSSHALLLRLFLSPSFFSLHVALKYLLLYIDNVGITYYLTRRLRELDVHELTDVWGFVCHLLISRPAKSRALECFVIDTAQKSTHIALLTLWFMQASLNDVSSRRDSRSFAVCQRTLLKCHEIIFGDQLLPSTSPYAGSKLPAWNRRKKINHHIEPVLAGIGMMLAGAPGLPRLTAVTGEVAIEQGRVEEGDGGRPWERQPEDAPVRVSVENSDDDADADEVESPASGSLGDKEEVLPAQSSLKISKKPKPVGAQTLPALPLHLQRQIRKPTISDDPLGQADYDAPSPSHSSPSLPSPRTPVRAIYTTRADSLLERYDTQSQVQLLRGHYYLSEVQFLLNLENICNRLVIVPKAARVSALRAELTALNHKLPAEVCMPMWCTSTDSIDQRGLPHPHHRVVRIPPGESVVLNSAERAPYLLLMEILTDDLDFDPSKRGNKDILRKVISKDEDPRTRSQLGFDTPTTARPFDLDAAIKTPLANTMPYMSDAPASASSTTSAFADEDEEVDLVEQLFGDDEQPLKSRILDIDDSIVLPPTPKNRELDMATWSRLSPAITPSPSLDPTLRTPPQLHSRTLSTRSTTEFNSRSQTPDTPDNQRALSLDEYSERMRTAAIMLAQLNSDLNGSISWSTDKQTDRPNDQPPQAARPRLPRAEALAIRERIMQEMNALEEERMERMRGKDSDLVIPTRDVSGSAKTAEDEGIIRRELNKVDPSAVIFSESWSAKKSRIRHESPYGHLANWDCVSVIVKTGGDLRQEQLAVQLIREFQVIWNEERCGCWVKYFRILATGSMSGLVETITDAVSIHSIKKAEYAKRLATGRLGHVTLMDHFKATYGDPSSAKFARAQHNFAKSLAGYSVVTYLLQVKDRHNGNILLDRDGHLIHIDFGFLFSNTPGNLGFEAAPFKLPYEYVEVLGGIDAPPFLEFRRLFHQGFEAARKHCDRIITLVELMQKDSTFPCFAASGEQTAAQLRERFQPTLTHSLVGDYMNRLIDTSLGSHWTRLYDSYQYYSQSIL